MWAVHQYPPCRRCGPAKGPRICVVNFIAFFMASTMQKVRIPTQHVLSLAQEVSRWRQGRLGIKSGCTGHKGASKGECYAQDTVGYRSLYQRRLKKNIRGKEKVMAVQSLIQQMSLNKALRRCGATPKRWYYKPKKKRGSWPSTGTCCS